MASSRHGLCLILALLAFAQPLAGRAQEALEDRQAFAEQVEVDYVLVPVVVSGRKGPLQDLPREAFELLVDGRPVEIESFETGDTPVTLFFLQDLSGSMQLVGRLRWSRSILDHFLDNATLGDRFAMITFASKSVETVVPLTSDLLEMHSAADAWKGYGTTALHDAIALLPDLIVDDPSSRRAVLLVSDGFDNASHETPADARDRMRASEIPVYVIGLETGSPFDLDSEGGKLYRYADVMNLLGHLTGGRYYSASDQEEIDEASAAVLAELRHQYILGFSSGGAEEAADHQIEVRVKRKHVEVSHRRGYLGRPPLAPRP